jgi:predicted dehydrogenase
MKPYSKVDDYFDLRLEYENLIVTLHASMLVREMGPRYMIHGTKGSYIKYGEDPQEEMLKAGMNPIGTDWGKEDPSTYGLIHTEWDGEIIRRPYPSLQASYGDYYKNLYNTIKNGAPLKETPLDGYNVIRLIELAFQSSKEKRTITCSWSQLPA